MENVERLMKGREVAEFLKVQTSTLDKWRWRGVGPKYVKLGRTVRYRLSDVQDYASNVVTPGSEEV